MDASTFTASNVVGKSLPGGEEKPGGTLMTDGLGPAAKAAAKIAAQV
jgi:hypothetical protein